MKNRNPKGNGNGEGSTMDGPKPMTMKKKKNMNRLGGRGTGLSLQAFANAKSTSNHYNPALIKKKKEFYKNAKYVNKYKQSLKQQNQGKNSLPSSQRTIEDENEDINGSRANNMNKKKKKKKNGSQSLRQVYEKQWEEKEKARMEREAAMQAKKEQRGKAEAQRKVERKEMFKKTRHGQPVMKYRIHHLLQSIQGSASASS
ncbi:stress response protein nst1-like [Gossypium australe]|uniref:Stress response protein nst1-like n=1 Tax=Gossypium australe TaxID=47621 RepID=A0A5B6W1I2_9ROSI|nr:stress response protein nst1-like [Gossypium australe]